MLMSFRTYRRGVNQSETDTKGRLFVVGVSINWPSNRKWQAKVLDSWKIAQLSLLRQECVNFPATRKVYLMDRSVYTIVRAASLR